ncbi:MAG: sugar isomerase domain-containing protein [Erysipelotrichaceae bacterium]|nr:sugar isomerase domain-containing protein [Erysipelotrichaceae bacterium]
MDIKKQYFDAVKKRIEEAYDLQAEKLKTVASMFGECMENGGVVQLVGYKHDEEFVNELNYRAGGIAPYHAIKLKDMMLKGLIKAEDIESGKVFEDYSLIDKIPQAYQLDSRDMYVIVDFYGNKPLFVELAKRMKEEGHKVIGVVNKKTYDEKGGTLLDYCDEYLDMCGDTKDVALDIDGIKVDQLSSTITNITAQELTAEVYSYYVSRGKEAPVLLSANIKGADIHNNSLTDPYERRVR